MKDKMKAVEKVAKTVVHSVDKRVAKWAVVKVFEKVVEMAEKRGKKMVVYSAA